jgi:transposase InsO family protein
VARSARPLIKRYRGSRTSFASIYTRADVLLLAHTDSVLEELLHSFPFKILGFHSDNGSEYINRHVAELLNKLLIEEQTKSRSRHSNDNAQAESKNGAIVRKHLGYSHIPQRFASMVNDFCRDHLNPYINFHRPCLFAETFTDAKGRQRKRYPHKLMMTPYEKLKSLPNAQQFLKPGITFQQLDALASAISDNDAAQRLNDVRARLFKTIFNRSKSAA